ncbi:MAG: hypothetical protein LBF61_00440 [Azoarcus sp.]|jgi:hypothetical protein|nr:hypothetical protein [Azoarcus sp.]
MDANDTSNMDDLFSAFVLSIVAVSFLAAPAIIAAGCATAMRRILITDERALTAKRPIPVRPRC